jgi:hypothetical protein
MNRQAVSSDAATAASGGGDHHMPSMAASEDVFNPSLVIGTLDLHGAPRLRVWTHVAPPGLPTGATTLPLSAPVDWAMGEDRGDLLHLGLHADEGGGGVGPGAGGHQCELPPPLAYAHTSTIVTAGQWGHADVYLR